MALFPFISVLMPAYNAAPYIAESIQSILAQTYHNWELIIVDDGSKDETFAIAKSFAKKDQRIRAIQQPNAGASAARNRAFELSKGEFIKYFDADDLLNPEALEAQVGLALKNPGCIISGKWGRFYNNDLSTFKLSPESVWWDMNGVDWIIESWSKGPNMTQPGIFLLPRNFIEDYGGWDECLSLMDDMEFFTRMILHSPNILFCDQSTLKYRSGIPNNLSKKKGENAVYSAWKAIEKSVNILLKKNNSQLAKISAANQLQSLVYRLYPDYPDICSSVEKDIRELGGATYLLPGGKGMGILRIVFGWKKAKKIHTLLNKWLAYLKTA